MSSPFIWLRADTVGTGSVLHLLAVLSYGPVARHQVVAAERQNGAALTAHFAEIVRRRQTRRAIETLRGGRVLSEATGGEHGVVGGLVEVCRRPHLVPKGEHIRNIVDIVHEQKTRQETEHIAVMRLVRQHLSGQHAAIANSWMCQITPEVVV